MPEDFEEYIIMNRVPIFHVVCCSALNLYLTPNVDPLEKKWEALHRLNYRNVQWRLVNRGSWGTGRLSLFAQPPLVMSYNINWIIKNSHFQLRSVWYRENVSHQSWILIHRL